MKLYLFDDTRCNQCGTMIRRLRKAQKMSQEILAGKLQVAGLNLNQKSISRIETGKRVVPDYELIYFSEVLNVPITALFETNKK
jgi:transcriptional regulator with XRE-family HTH domain